MSVTDGSAGQQRGLRRILRQGRPAPPPRQEETGIKPEWAAEAFSDLDEDVRQSIARIKASPFIPKKDSIRGFVYQVEDGKLREVT